MRDCCIINGSAYVNHRFEETTVQIREGKLYLRPSGEEIPPGMTVYDGSGCRVVPGFIDIHTHGAAGVDVNAASAEDLARIGRFMASKGTTAWLCSVLTDTREQTEWCIDQATACMSRQEEEKKESGLKGAALLGIHLEGPFLASEYKGAMPEYLLQKGNLGLLREYQKRAQGRVRYITVSPEVEGVLGLIPEMKELGMAVAMGHSGAEYDTAMEAVRQGVTAATHTMNAMKPLHQHFPGVLGAALESDVYCEMICDGRHLHPGIVRLLLKIKGTDRTIAVTDSIMAAGLSDGRYRLGVNEVIVEKGDAKLADTGTRAGSTLTMDKALQNLISFTGRPVEEVLPLLTENPARLLGLHHRKGFLRDGADADLVLLNVQNEIQDVFLEGSILQPAEEHPVG
ncbi:MAG: N-acetylglucosamine-6-phosphate deacetylase [Lachnospiraceae bacterium]|nr:N-acetylglucosamine-6-phosphate deacetylase [Lachnospiraceae bacterium]